MPDAGGRSSKTQKGQKPSGGSLCDLITDENVGGIKLEGDGGFLSHRQRDPLNDFPGGRDEAYRVKLRNIGPEFHGKSGGGIRHTQFHILICLIWGKTARIVMPESGFISGTGDAGKTAGAA